MVQVASAGRIVMLSFHQPSPSMFSLLDRAYLLARGSCVFSGPPSAAEAHFAAHGLPCPVGSAVAEHMLQVCYWWCHNGQAPTLVNVGCLPPGVGCGRAYAAGVLAVVPFVEEIYCEKTHLCALCCERFLVPI